ncbi:MAG TPA: alanine racemase [Nocardioidaceae bacterium]|jgi:hypothetical protein|nr:alanine racemase [Nocardioidaceae bacterium]
MPLTLHVDGDRWRASLRTTADRYGSELVPVVKGNGYGFGLAGLARRCQWLGVGCVAVGTYAEAPAVLSRFGGSVLVLEPWRDFLPAVRAGEARDPRLVHTVGRLDDLAALSAHPGARILVEALTSMGRHGMSRHDLAAAAGLVRRGRLRLEGLALHLPLAGDREPEAEHWAAVLEASHLDTRRLWVSHLSADQVDRLRRARPSLTVTPRVGTGLWLGDRGALRVGATVLDAHQVAGGDRVGYRQRAITRAGTVLVVSGGTSHGIGLEAPTSVPGLRRRAAALARGGLDAAGFALSPFRVGGRQRWFVEPPHMQVSLLFLPAGVPAPPVGSEVDADVRFTTTTFDAVDLP